MPTEDKPQAGSSTGLIGNVAAKLAGTLLAFASYALVARATSPQDFGLVSLALAWVAVATAAGGLSMPLLVVRLVGEYRVNGESALVRGVIRFAFASSTLWTLLLVVAAAAGLAWNWVPATETQLRAAPFAAALLLGSVVLSILGGLLQAFKLVLRAELITNVARSVLLIAWLMAARRPGGEPLGFVQVLGAYAGICLLLVAACGFQLWRVLARNGLSNGQARYRIRAWAGAAAAFMAVLLASAVNERIDLMMLGLTSEPSEVAIYAVAQRFAQTIILAANAIAAAMGPHFVELLAASPESHSPEVLALLRRTARVMLASAAAAWLVFAIIGPMLLDLFGRHYAAALVPLLILASGQVAAALFGPAIMISTLAGQARIATACLVVGILSNALLNGLLAPLYGATGAAVATAFATAATAALASRWLRRTIGLDSGAWVTPRGRPA